MHPVLLFAGFFIISMAHNLLGPLIPNIMGSTDMTLADSGLLMSFQQIGSVIAIILSLSFFKHKKQPSVLKIGYLFFILSLGAVVLISGKALLYLLYIVIGFGIFLIDSSSNAIISSEYFEKRTTYLPLLHFFFSMGAIATGYIILPFKGPQWRWAYGITAALMALTAIAGISWCARHKKNNKAQGVTSPEPAKVPSITPMLKDPAYVLYAVLFTFYNGSLGLLANWIPVYVELELLQSPTLVGASLTSFWVGIAIARLSNGPILHKGLDPLKLSTAGLILSGISLNMAMNTHSVTAFFILIILCGFFSGAVIPMFLVVTPAWYPKNTAFISLSYILTGTAGRMLFPWLAGYLASRSSLKSTLNMSSSLFYIGAALVIAVQVLLYKRKRTTSASSTEK
ncbi:MAG: MFS transporter [Sphaerochaetaceae bacterium]|jgi:MFS family permease|nr:MFS transporter [Sphaerochaetaceae bacterium]NLO59677.1 MFS transporter [Spirochaetales bacterium]MDD4259043.1 MFS transporter [Sphaerochaetaceae bacterium]MDD4763831.1 MFS transporter [Sphaerochaetaceae bacterium]MDD4841250.1 MFS transporter [Sphaerochaetaceae bacterium]